MATLWTYATMFVVVFGCGYWGLTHRRQRSPATPSAVVVFVVGMGEHDVRRFDVAVQQALPVRVVERTCHSGDDRQDHVDWHSGGVTAGEQAARVLTVDKVHRKPELAVVFA